MAKPLHIRTVEEPVNEPEDNEVMPGPVAPDQIRIKGIDFLGRKALSSPEADDGYGQRDEAPLEPLRNDLADRKKKAGPRMSGPNEELLAFLLARGVRREKKKRGILKKHEEIQYFNQNERDPKAAQKPFLIERPDEGCVCLQQNVVAARDLLSITQALLMAHKQNPNGKLVFEGGTEDERALLQNMAHVLGLPVAGDHKPDGAELKVLSAQLAGQLQRLGVPEELCYRTPAPATPDEGPALQGQSGAGPQAEADPFEDLDEAPDEAALPDNVQPIGAPPSL